MRVLGGWLTDRIANRARLIAAHMLECAEEDLDYAGAIYSVRGTDRQVTFRDVADNAYHGALLPSGPDGTVTPGLEETVFWEPQDTNDPQAMHLAVVLVDADTGKVTLRDYFTSDDCGVVINPMIVEGQVHGGLGQGIGQALMENVTYDAGGQILAGSFLDYCMPRADDLPMIETSDFVKACQTNPLGVKGGGESGTVGSTAAVVNAIVDALSDYGVKDIDMPVSPLRVWQAMQGEKAA